MKRLLISLSLLCCCCLVYAQRPARDSVHLIILHTNDTHSRIDPIEETASRYADRGGVLRREAAISQIRKEADALQAEVLLLDAGDFVQGTPYFNFFHGKIEVEMMNRMHYDAVTLGNHEFDRGIPALAKMLSKADFPVICSNYDLNATDLAGQTLPYLVLRKGALKVGIVSACIKLDNLVMPVNRENLVYMDAIEQADAYAAMLKEQSCDIVICLSHLGYSSRGICDIKLAENTHHIDVIVGGHSHTFLKAPRTYYNKDGKAVLITQAGKDGVYLGRMDLMVAVQ